MVVRLSAASRLAPIVTAADPFSCHADRAPYGHYDGEAEILTEMRRLGGKDAPSAVASILNARGVLNRAGKPWHPFSVSRILKGAQ